MTSRSHSDVEMMLAASQSRASIRGDQRQNDGTEFDPAVPEAYSTLDTAKEEHAKYNSDQVKRTDDCSVANGSPNQAGADPLYEFDGVSPSEGGVSVRTVTVGGSEGGGSGGGVIVGLAPKLSSSLQRPKQRYEAKNILYEDTQLPADTFKHRGLHGNSYGAYNLHEKGGGSYVTCRCRTKTLVVSFFITLVLVLAVASLVLSTLLWFGVYEPSSTTSSSAPTSSDPPVECDCPTQAEVQELKSAVTAAKERIELLNNRSALQWSQRETLHTQLSLIQTNVTNLADNLASLPMKRQVSIPGFNPFEGCESRDDESISCTIPPPLAETTYEPCLTPEVQLEKEGYFLLYAECRKTGPNPLPDGEKISAALEIFLHDDIVYMRCSCSRLLDYAGQPFNGSIDHYCTLRETRCPLTVSVNATLAWGTK